MQIDIEKCVGCGGCVNLCPQAAIYFMDNKAVIDQFVCTECRTCVFVCGMGGSGGELPVSAHDRVYRGSRLRRRKKPSQGRRSA